MSQYAYADIKVEVRDGVFQPTETTKLILDHFAKAGVPQGDTMLDLGCGCGIVGLALTRAGYAGTVHASDISKEAVDNVRANFGRYGLKVDARAGSIFEPWEDMTFDVVLDDVSGIAESIARISPWFGTAISCESGNDGTELTVRVIRESPRYLTSDGALYFPALGLSNYPRIVEAAEEVFVHVEEVARKPFYFPADLTTVHADVLRDAMNRKDIIVEVKFGMYIWETRIYKAWSPRGPGGVK